MRASAHAAGEDEPEPLIDRRRRALLRAAAGSIAGAGLGAAALPVPASHEIAFRLVRHGTEIGRHTLAFTEADGALRVEIAVDVRVTLISIPIVHYMHRASETWRDGALFALHAETDKNGDHETMTAQRDAGGLAVSGSKAPRYLAPPDALPTSYWDKRMLAGPMISLEDGKLLRPTVEDRGEQDVRTAAGMIQANHYKISGAFDADVFYDLSDRWAGLGLSFADGSEVRYERL